MSERATGERGSFAGERVPERPVVTEPLPDERRARLALTLAITATGLAGTATIVGLLAFKAWDRGHAGRGWSSDEIPGTLLEPAALVSVISLALSTAIAWWSGGGRLATSALGVSSALGFVAFGALLDRTLEGSLDWGGGSLALRSSILGLAGSGVAIASAAIFSATRASSARSWRREPLDARSRLLDRDDSPIEHRALRVVVVLAIASALGIAGGAIAAHGTNEATTGALGGAGGVLSLSLASARVLRRRIAREVNAALVVALPAGVLAVVASTWGATLLTKGPLAYVAFTDRLLVAHGSTLFFQSIEASIGACALLGMVTLVARISRVAVLALATTFTGGLVIVLAPDVDPLLAVVGCLVASSSFIAAELEKPRVSCNADGSRYNAPRSEGP